MSSDKCMWEKTAWKLVGEKMRCRKSCLCGSCTMRNGNWKLGKCHRELCSQEGPGDPSHIRAERRRKLTSTTGMHKGSGGSWCQVME